MALTKQLTCLLSKDDGDEGRGKKRLSRRDFFSDKPLSQNPSLMVLLYCLVNKLFYRPLL